jgi:colanic acid/amylovoran biosynthesis glycosyltransferase
MSQLGSPKKIAYVVSRFPALTETFILRELNAVDAAPEVEVELFSLFRGERGAVHKAAERWLPKVHQAHPLEAARGLAWWLRRSPRRFLHTGALAVRAHASRPGVLLRALVTFAIAAAHARKVVRLGVEHVHAHWATYPALTAWVCHRLAGVPYSFSAHAHDIFIHQVGLEAKVRDARFVVTISEYNRTFLRAFAGNGVPLHVIHYGLDLAAYRFRPRAPRPRGVVNALCIASFQEYKGHCVLFEALARGGSDLDRIRLVLVGEGPLRDALEALATKLGIRERVEFRGGCLEHEVASLLDTADLLVLPSIVAANGDTEGIPNALLEAMACGVPVVTTRVSGIPELVRHNETGLLAEPADSDSLCDALRRTLVEPEAVVARAEAGRRLVEEEFTLAASAGALMRLFLGDLRTSLMSESADE